MRENVHALLLLLLIELFSFRIETNGWDSPAQWHLTATRFSVGLPLMGASITTHTTTGNMPPWTNYPERSKWRPGLRFYPVAQVVDALTAIALFLGIRWLLQYAIARLIFVGIAVGAAFGLLINLGTHPPTRTFSYDPVTWFNGVVVFLVLPLVILMLTRDVHGLAKPILLVVVVLLVAPWVSFWCDQFAPELHPWAVTQRPGIREPSFEDNLIEPVMVGIVVAILVLLGRRFLPLFRRREAAG